MTEVRKPPVKLNLGGKTLGSIVEGLGGLGWATNDLPTNDMDIMMIHGDMRGAEFWHQLPNTTAGNIITLHGAHKDTLLYIKNSLVRDCPTGGHKVIASLATPG